MLYLIISVRLERTAALISHCIGELVCFESDSQLKSLTTDCKQYRTLVIARPAYNIGAMLLPSRYAHDIDGVLGYQTSDGDLGDALFGKVISFLSRYVYILSRRLSAFQHSRR